MPSEHFASYRQPGWRVRKLLTSRFLQSLDLLSFRLIWPVRICLSGGEFSFLHIFNLHSKHSQANRVKWATARRLVIANDSLVIDVAVWYCASLITANQCTDFLEVLIMSYKSFLNGAKSFQRNRTQGRTQLISRCNKCHQKNFAWFINGNDSLPNLLESFGWSPNSGLIELHSISDFTWLIWMRPLWKFSLNLKAPRKLFSECHGKLCNVKFGIVYRIGDASLVRIFNPLEPVAGRIRLKLRIAWTNGICLKWTVFQ